MPNYCDIIVVGHLGRDPEMRHMADGKAIANFSIAVTDRGGRDGDITSWFRCSLFGRQAEIAEKYLRKGSAALVQGRMRERTWSDKDGNERKTWEVVGDRLVLLGRADNSPPTLDVAPAPRQQSSVPAVAGGPIESMDDDIPF